MYDALVFKAEDCLIVLLKYLQDNQKNFKFDFVLFLSQMLLMYNYQHKLDRANDPNAMNK